VLRALEGLGLAKVLRVAPALEVRPDVTEPDAETLRAIMAHRFSVMKAYWKTVLVPAVQAEASAASASVVRLSGRLRRALANDGRWLDEPARAKLAALIEARPRLATVVEYRRRLAALLDRAGRGSAEVLAGLKEWCRDAEASGIQSLSEYAKALRGYALNPARTRG
jgi:stearoyl-CoA desaturase (Delta-9 desaturase)